MAITSSCLHEFPAATALAVAMVMPFVILIDSSGDDVFSGTSFDWNTWKLEREVVKKIRKARTKIIYSFPTRLRAQCLKTEPATGRKRQMAGNEKFNLSTVILFLLSRLPARLSLAHLS